MKVGKILLMAIFLCFTINVRGEQRVVVAEGFTATWCGCCPYSARAIHRLSKEVGDSMAVMEYHLNDPFSTSETSARANYYNISSIPHMWFDGVLNYVGGGSGNYNQYRNAFNTRKTIPSPLLIALSGSYNQATMQGTVDAHITNTSENQVSGTLQFVLTETNIQYHWQNEDSLFDVVRDMIPNASGEAISIEAGESIDKSRNFTVNPGWDADNCDIVVFVQAGSKEIYQGAKSHIMDLGIEENSNLKAQNSKFVESCGLEIYPNPFSKETHIVFSILHLAEDSNYLLRIYDITGRLVNSINSMSSTNSTTVTWDCKDGTGKFVESGVYFCQLIVGDRSIIKKMIVMR
ncbi:MAG: Omp28-related outer membrane protein [bacterium]|nr:Omp28-related outer membrane protein [bacterium]